MVHVVILAGGKGTRMQSEIPKVLHPVKGVPIIQRLLKTVTQIDTKPTIIIGHKGQTIIDATGNRYDYVEQREQLGTGHAIKTAKDGLKILGANTIVVLPGDHPLISAGTIRNMVQVHDTTDAVVTICTAKVDTDNMYAAIFNNYGRIIRTKEGEVEKIVEFKDASPEQKEIREFNLSYYCFESKWLWENIDKLTNGNAQNEYYLTDMVQIAKEQGRTVSSYEVKDLIETLGINSPEQLKIVEDSIAEEYAVGEAEQEVLTQ